MSDKAIKITFVVDKSLDDAKRKIGELISEVNKLGDATKGLGILGGGGMSVGSRSQTPGAGSALTNATHAVKGSMGGTNAMASAVANTANAMKQSAQAGVGAFKEMDKAMQSFVQAAGGKLQVFYDVVSKLGTAFGSLKKNVAGMGGGGAGGGGGGGTAAYGPGDRYGGLAAVGRGGGGAAAGGMAGWATTGLLFGGAGLAAAGAVYGMNSLGNQSMMSQLQYQREQPGWAMSRAAQLGSMYGGNALALRGGQVSLGLSQQRAAASERGKFTMSDEWMKTRTEEIRRQNPTGRNAWQGFKAAFGTGNLGKYVGAELGDAWSDLTGESGKSFINKDSLVGRMFHTGGTRTNTMQIAKSTAERNLPVERAQAIQQTALDEKMADSLFMSRLDEQYGGRHSEAAMARATGMSGNVLTIKNKREQRLTTMAEHIKARAEAMHFTPDELTGASASLRASAGWGYTGLGRAGNILSKQAGGLSSASAMFGLGGQFGNADKFLGSISGKSSAVGSRGLDVSAANQVFGAGAGYLTSGNFMGGGDAASSFMNTIASAASSAGGPGADMRGARVVAAGLGEMANTMSGRRDGLQKGMNAAAAIAVAGDMPPMVRTMLTTMDPATMMGILKTGKVPAEILQFFPDKDKKNAFETIKKYQEQVFGGSLAIRLTDTMYGNTEAGKLVDKFRHGGTSAILAGAKGRGAQEKRLKSLAQALHPGSSQSLESIEGMLRLTAGISGDMKQVRGGGVHDPLSGKSTAAKAMAAEAEVNKTEGKERAEEKMLTDEAIGKHAGAVKEGNKAAREAPRAGAAGDINSAISGVDSALRAFVSALQGMSSRRPGPVTSAG